MKSITSNQDPKSFSVLPEDIRSHAEVSTIQYSTPYIIEMNDGKRSFYYYGAGHSFNPDNPMFEQLEHQFIALKPDILFIEGASIYNSNRKEREKRFLEMDRNQLIKDYGESGFMIRLAAETKTEYICPEPDYGYEINEVLKTGFNKEDIFAYYMYRTIYQYRLIPNPDISLEDYLQKYIDHFKGNTNWTDLEYSIEHLRRIGQRIWGDSGDFKTGDFRIDPIPWESRKDSWTIVNDVCQASSEIRERFIIQRIGEEILKGKNIFVVYGSGHAVREEPGLRRIFSLLSQKPSV